MNSTRARSATKSRPTSTPSPTRPTGACCWVRRAVGPSSVVVELVICLLRVCVVWLLHCLCIAVRGSRVSCHKHSLLIPPSPLSLSLSPAPSPPPLLSPSPLSSSSPYFSLPPLSLLQIARTSPFSARELVSSTECHFVWPSPLSWFKQGGGPASLILNILI